MSKRLLTADIGGSKTRLRLLDMQGDLHQEILGTGVASIIDETSALPTLDALLEQIPQKESVGAIAINLGGRNTTQVQNSFRQYFPSTPIRIFRESEGTAAFALGEEYGASIILMAGTGAIAVGHLDHQYVITGGWGIHIGDDGSGYDIGLQAIRMSLRALDGTSPLSPLTQFLCEQALPLAPTSDPTRFRDRRDQVRERLLPLDRAHIASLTKHVATFAEQGDATALRIFEYAGEKLSELVTDTAKKLNISTPTVVVTGGLIHTRKFWASRFESTLPNSPIHYVEDGLLRGTYRIAKELYETR